MFRFQRFSIADDRCGMKVGIDGVLRGAWADVYGAARILDIGTGSGLLALMLAQRSETLKAQIDAVEIDPEAAQQASENVSQSPWSDRIRVMREDISVFAARDSIHARDYDLIVCNPPFFLDDLESEKKAERTARHSTRRFRQSLVNSARTLLGAEGKLSLVLPASQCNELVDAAKNLGLHVSRLTWVNPLPKRPFHRVLIELARHESEPLVQEMTIETRHHEFSPQFAELTRNFYLRFA